MYIYRERDIMYIYIYTERERYDNANDKETSAPRTL